jgi:hypothetical protein
MEADEASRIAKEYHSKVKSELSALIKLNFHDDEVAATFKKYIDCKQISQFEVYSVLFYLRNEVEKLNGDLAGKSKTEIVRDVITTYCIGRDMKLL